MAKADLTCAQLRQWYDYDPDTGRFWRKQRPKVHPGLAGNVNSNGYMVMKVDGYDYKAHRLVWLYVFGEWPRQEVDHKDGDRANNRLANLRDISPSHNQQNRRSAARHNATGLLGVRKSGRGFSAVISVDGQTRYLGTLATPEVAHQVYLSEKRRHHPGCTL